MDDPTGYTGALYTVLLMRKAQQKAHGQQSCRAQHAKEIQDARDLQKPLLVRSKTPAEQLPKLRREVAENRQRDIHAFPRSLLKQTVLKHHVSTKCTRRIRITKDNPSMGASSHCIKYHSSARSWEGV